MAGKEEQKSLLMKVKEENEKAGIRLSILNRKIMAFSPFTSWQINKETGNSGRLYFWGAPKSLRMVTTDMKLIGSPWEKAMRNIESILKSRDITLLMNVHILKAIIFPVAIYEFEIWVIKKAEHQRIGTFELCREDSRVPWTAR